MKEKAKDNVAALVAAADGKKGSPALTLAARSGSALFAAEGVDLNVLVHTANAQLDRDGRAFTKADYVQCLFVLTALAAQRDARSVPASFHAEMERLTVDALIRLLRARLYDPETLQLRAPRGAAPRPEASTPASAPSPPLRPDPSAPPYPPLVAQKM